MLSANCIECKRDEDLKKAWACNTVAAEAVWGFEDDIFYSCPINFIPCSVSFFVELYTLIKEFNISLHIWELDNKFVEMFFTFKRYVDKYTAFISKKEQK